MRVRGPAPPSAPGGPAWVPRVLLCVPGAAEGHTAACPARPCAAPVDLSAGSTPSQHCRSRYRGSVVPRLPPPWIFLVGKHAASPGSCYTVCSLRVCQRAPLRFRLSPQRLLQCPARWALLSPGGILRLSSNESCIFMSFGLFLRIVPFLVAALFGCCYG